LNAIQQASYHLPSLVFGSYYVDLKHKAGHDLVSGSNKTHYTEYFW